MTAVPFNAPRHQRGLAQRISFNKPCNQVIKPDREALRTLFRLFGTGNGTIARVLYALDQKNARNALPMRVANPGGGEGSGISAMMSVRSGSS